MFEPVLHVPERRSG